MARSDCFSTAMGFISDLKDNKNVVISSYYEKMTEI